MSIVDLGQAAARMAEVVGGVPDGMLDVPTPCPEYSLGDLLDHVSGLSLAFTAAATKSPPPPGAHERASGDASKLGEDWRTTIPEAVAGLAVAWRDPEAWTGMTRAGGIDLPGEVAGIVALDELVLHAWDLARASGQSYDADPQTLEVVHGFVEQFSGEGAAAMREGLFGAVFPVPDDAPLLDRTLGLAGRDPDWSPA